jgi:predicted metal-dependent phosphoesterase TrpH
MPLRCLFHLHTKFSFDSCVSPRKIISHARDNKVDVLVVTDHNTLRGAREVSKLAGGKPPYVIIAGEYKTEKGDIIGMFLKEEIESRESNEVIREIKRQGGLAVLPHPYKGHRLDEILLSQMDLIETFNARCSASDNASSVELAQRLGKPSLAGCDAHCAAELNAAVLELAVESPLDRQGLQNAFLTAPRSVETRPVSKIYQVYSQMIKAVKTRDFLLFLYQVKRGLLLIVKDRPFL